MKTKLIMPAAMVFLVAALPSQAGFIQYSDPTTFYNDVGSGLSVENFESASPGTVIANGTTLNGITYGLNDSSIDFVINNTVDTSSGENALATSSGPFLDLLDMVTFDFDYITNAFGISFSLSDTPLAGELFLSIEGQNFGIEAANPVSTLADGSLSYFIGVISDDTLFNKVTIGTFDDGDTNFDFVMDDLAINAISVPEPTSATLFSFCLFALFGRKATRFLSISRIKEK